MLAFKSEARKTIATFIFSNSGSADTVFVIFCASSSQPTLSRDLSRSFLQVFGTSSDSILQGKAKQVEGKVFVVGLPKDTA